MAAEPLNIAVGGCGIGGLAVAGLLARQGHRVTVYDQFREPEPVGSGLVIQPVGQAVLDAVGALEPALRSGRKITYLSGRITGSNKQVLGVGYGSRFGLAIHRAGLFSTLLHTAQSAGVRLCANSRIRASTLTAKGRFLEFDRAPSAGPFDLVIDATGAHSPLSAIKNRQLPFGALWANVDWPDETDLPGDHLSQIYQRSNIMAGVLPIGRLGGTGRDRAAIFWSLNHNAYSGW